MYLLLDSLVPPLERALLNHSIRPLTSPHTQLTPAAPNHIASDGKAPGPQAPAPAIQAPAGFCTCPPGRYPVLTPVESPPGGYPPEKLTQQHTHSTAVKMQIFQGLLYYRRIESDLSSKVSSIFAAGVSRGFQAPALSPATSRAAAVVSSMQMCRCVGRDPPPPRQSSPLHLLGLIHCRSKMQLPSCKS